MIHRLALVGIVVWLGFAGQARAAESYPMNNGNALSGDFVNALPAGLVVRQSDGTLSERVAWTNFTQVALKQLAANPKAKFFVEALLDVDEEEPAKKAAAEKIKPKDFPKMARPDPKAGLGAMFSSALSLAIFGVLYLANIYAGFEVAVFRNFPVALGCGVAAVVPVLGPAVLLCLPTHIRKTAEEEAAELAAAADAAHAEAHPEEAAVAAHAHAPEAAPAQGHAPAVPGLPPPTVYQRGVTTFNRRFFETKFAGFLRMVPGEAEKDMVIHVKSARGEHAGQRIARIQPNELYLQVTKGGASSEVMIPYTEISEVQVRHKDL